MTFFSGIKYDAEKEERQLQEARQRELQRIEDTKLKAAEQGQGSALISHGHGFLFMSSCVVSDELEVFTLGIFCGSALLSQNTVTVQNKKRTE